MIKLRMWKELRILNYKVWNLDSRLLFITTLSLHFHVFLHTLSKILIFASTNGVHMPACKSTTSVKVAIVFWSYNIYRKVNRINHKINQSRTSKTVAMILSKLAWTLKTQFGICTHTHMWTNMSFLYKPYLGITLTIFYHLININDVFIFPFHTKIYFLFVRRVL